jgi:hypothetical protein
VAGLQRDQIVMLSLATSPVTVSDWATTRYQQQCAKVFDTYMRDVDISPDGSYFVVGTTGAYRAGSLCDGAARWETGASGAGQQPTWVDYTGGDTLYSVAITGTAVYVGGHQRWMNNSFAADRAGPGAVAREGIAALDPVNGLPLSWNPGRDRGVGAFALVATSQGLWIGSDTDRIGRYEYHGRIAFMPLAGGTPVPESRVGTLPGDLFRLGTDGAMTRRSFTGTTLGSPSTVTTGVDWSTIRGAFVVSGRLYTDHADGTMTVRDFDGTTAASPPDPPQRPDQHPVPHHPHHRHVLLERPPLLHPQRRHPPLLPLVHPRERRPGRRHLHRQRRHRRPQLGRRQRHDHGLRPPRLRHHHRYPVRHRLHQRPPHRHDDGPERPRRRRPVLAVQGVARPQPGQLKGPRVRYPAPRQPL